MRLLALTHISSRYAGGELRDQARAVFAATEAPRDFDTIEVPFPERGAPSSCAGPSAARASAAPRRAAGDAPTASPSRAP